MNYIKRKEIDLPFWRKKKNRGIWYEYKDGTNCRGFVVGFRFSSMYPDRCLGIYVSGWRAPWGHVWEADYIGFGSLEDFMPCDDVVEIRDW